jgi:peptide/nickel transport system ATP-binding protein
MRTRPKLLTGDVPSPANPPSGCFFHPRCPYAQPVCAEETPPVRQVGDGHLSACHFAGDLPLEGAVTVIPPAPAIS